MIPPKTTEHLEKTTTKTQGGIIYFFGTSPSGTNGRTVENETMGTWSDEGTYVQDGMQDIGRNVDMSVSVRCERQDARRMVVQA